MTDKERARKWRDKLKEKALEAKARNHGAESATTNPSMWDVALFFSE